MSPTYIIIIVTWYDSQNVPFAQVQNNKNANLNNYAMTRNDEIVVRLGEAMQGLGMDKAALDRALLLKGNISKYFNGVRSAAPLAYKLTELGISADWYLTGRGNMLLKDNAAAKTPEDHRHERLGQQFEEMVMTVLAGAVTQDAAEAASTGGDEDIPQEKRLSYDEFARLLAIRGGKMLVREGH